MTVFVNAANLDRWDYHETYDQAATASDLLIKITAVAKIIFEFMNIPLSKGIKEGIELLKVLKALKMPKLFQKLYKAKTSKESALAGVAFYFCLFDVRKALKSISSSEFPLAAVLGLGGVELFRESLNRYQNYVAEEEAVMEQSAEAVDAYISACELSQYDIWEKGLAVVTALSIGAQMIFPQFLAITTIGNAAKLGTLSIQLFLAANK